MPFFVLLNDQIGRYEIRSRLGSGAFATVFEAFDPRLESRVALKLLADNWIHDPEVRARFRQEAVLLRRVQTEHPAAPLLDVYDIDETTDGRPYFVMRLADRGSLADRSAPGRTWPAEAVRPVIDVLEAALSTLHRAGIVHRDVKPSNLMLTTSSGAPAIAPVPSGAVLVAPDERMLLGDLGLAKDTLVSGTSLTIAGGTPRFMAPEQRDPAAVIDHRADLFAATAVVADLFTGAPAIPADESSTGATARAQFAKGLAVDPDDRHADAEAWATAMRQAIDPNDSVDSNDPASVAPPLPDQRIGTLDRSDRFRAGPLVAAGVSLFVVVAVLVALAVARLMGGGSAIEGPTEANVGETVTLSAEVDDGDRYVWRVGGREVSDLDLQLTPDRAGFIDVELEVTAADGTTETSSTRITVTE